MKYACFGNLLRFATHPAALSSFQSSGQITRDKRKMPQLGIFPNFFRFAPETSFIPDVAATSLAPLALVVVLTDASSDAATGRAYSAVGRAARWPSAPLATSPNSAYPTSRPNMRFVPGRDDGISAAHYMKSLILL